MMTQSVTRMVSRAILKTKINSPVILFATGAVSVTASVVLASRAALKVHDILDENEKELQNIEKARELSPQKYTIEDVAKDHRTLKIQTAVKLGKNYAPAAVALIFGIGCFAQSNRILFQRNAALTLAYAGLDRAFKYYRKGIADQFGEEKEAEYYRESQAKQITRNDDGTFKARDKQITDRSPYARFYDDFAKNWQKEPEYNMFFIKAQQNYANDRLRSRGHVFLNEVYDWLGLERSKAGQLVGWVWDGDGDNYIDFGIFKRDTDAVRDFVNGHERSILLDFNVDGPIHDHLD